MVLPLVEDVPRSLVLREAAVSLARRLTPAGLRTAASRLDETPPNPTEKVRIQMKIVVIGGTGLIGSKLVTKLNQQGHEAVAASPSRGVNTITGEGVAAAMEGASIVVDVSNSPSFEYRAALEFFQTSTRNLQAAETAAGVGHHVALSVVGTDRLAESGTSERKLLRKR